MENKVKAFIRELKMIRSGDHIVAGVSGGGDSMALLDILCSIREEEGFTVSVLHIHHGLRGKEADRDAELVKRFCEKKSIPCSIQYYDVRKEAARRKIGTEEMGRILRREAFEADVRKLEERNLHPGCVKIALAHHADDLAETMLHHMARGTGLTGLAAIRPVRGNYIRPLLKCSRSEIDAYLEEKQIPYVTDSTNLEDDYTRNRIRHHILKNLKETVNAKTVEHFSELSFLAGQVDEYLEEQAEAALKACSRESENGILLTDRIFQEKMILQQYVVRKAMKQVSGKEKDLSSGHIHDVCLLASKKQGKRVNLPYRMEAIRKEDGILLRMEQKQEKADSVKTIEIQIPGSIEIEGGQFLFAKKDVNSQVICEKKYTKWLDYDRITMNLCVRTRRPGDYLVINDQNQKKMLNRFFIDQKIPAEKRDEILLVADGSHIVWIVGYRISAAYKVNENTKNVLEISYSGGK